MIFNHTIRNGLAGIRHTNERIHKNNYKELPPHVIMETIHATGFLNERLTFHSATAERDIKIDYVKVTGPVISTLGKIQAYNSLLGNTIASDSVELTNSSAKEVQSLFDHVTVRRTDEETSQLSNIQAKKNINISRASVKKGIRSLSENVSIHQSTVGDVKAWKDITLTCSSARTVESTFGNVTVAKTDQNSLVSVKAWGNITITEAAVSGKIKSTFGTVKAHRSALQNVQAKKDIELTNSSAKDVKSSLGSVTVHQTDGTMRSFSHISAKNAAFIKNSAVENITLHVDPSRQAVLNLTNTKVAEKIAIKVDGAIRPESNWFFASLKQVARIEPKPKKPAAVGFTLLIQADTMPKNILFEGFEANEIAMQKTDDGILVTGKQKGR